MRVKVCQTLIEPREVQVASQNGPLTYTVVPSTIWNDGICDCKGFQFRGDCKHLTAIEEQACSFLAPLGFSEQIDECPECGAPIAQIELEPEFGPRDQGE